MTSRQNRIVAFLLAALLLWNTAVLPTPAEAFPDASATVTEEAPPVTTPPATTPPATEAPTEAPTAAPTAPEAETAAPAEPSEETNAPTEPTLEPSAPAEETTEPSGAVTEPTEAPTEPTEEVTEPTEETRPMLTEELLRSMQQEGYQQAIAYYRALPICAERSMPLEWWYVLTGKVSMREPDLSVLDTASDEEAASVMDALGAAEPDSYVEYPQWITVSSDRELILLSYVSPQSYNTRTITLLAGEDAQYDLTQSVTVDADGGQALSYQGLGGLDYPFRGELNFVGSAQYVSFLLNSPLFIGLHCRADFLDEEGRVQLLRLTSHAESFFDGLLARHVVGETGLTAHWSVQLNAPSASEGHAFYLPSLLGVIYGNTSVHLTLADNSGLKPSARGYLCATMYGNAALEAQNITRTLSVPLVGELSEQATVITDAPGNETQLVETEPEETEPEQTEPEETEPEETVPVETEPVETEPVETEPVETEPVETEPVETEPEETEPMETEPEEAPSLTEEEYLELLEKAIAFYRAMEIIPGRMPLEWWYVISGQAIPGSDEAWCVIHGEDFLRYLETLSEEEPTVPTEESSTLPPEETTAPSGEAASPEETAPDGEAVGEVQTQPAQTEAAAAENAGLNDLAEARVVPYADVSFADVAVHALDIPVSGTIQINSLEDLIALSLVDPSTYQGRTIEFVLITGGVNKFDTTEPISIDGTEVSFLGLGSDDFPFRGAVIFPAGSENLSFQIARPLFNALGSDAALENINLICASTSPIGGMLAKNVYGDGSANWSVTLMAPEEGNATLSPVIGTLKTGADLSLKVTDASGKSVSGSGYLCGVMEANSRLTVSELGTIPAVSNPDGGDTGGLVGSMGSGAKLTVTSEVGSVSVAGSSGSTGGLVGSMGTGAMLNVTLPEAFRATVTASGDNAGGLVGNMDAGAGLTVASAMDVTVSGTGTNAGGLVGQMADGAALEVSSAITVRSVEGKTNVGGIIGSCTNPTLVFGAAASVSGADGSGTVHATAGGSVGGIAGALTWSMDGESMALLPVSSLSITNGDAGGLYGTVRNEGKSLVIAYAGALVSNVTLQGGGKGRKAVGGLIGWYDGNGTCSLRVEKDVTVDVTASNAQYLGGLIGAPDNGTHILKLSGNVTLRGAQNVDSVGGAIGIVRRGMASAQFADLTVQIVSDSVPATSYGGLIAELDDYGSLVHVGSNVNLSAAKIIGSGSSGGLVGKMPSGVLYLADNPEMPQAASATNVNTRGFVLGNRGHTLVCAEKEWPAGMGEAFQMNDTNQWGQVLQLTRFDPELITLSEDKMTATVRALPAQDGGAYSIGNLTDFAAVALRMQLNQKGALVIPGDFTYGSNVSLTLSANIDLNGTGLTGLTRDWSDTDLFHITLDGGGFAVTHPSLTVFPSAGAHNRQGLIGRVGTLALSNLTYNGTGTFVSLGGETASGIACYVDNDATLRNVTSSVGWSFSGSPGDSKLSGLVAEITGDNKTVTFEGCRWNGSITDSAANGNHDAGFLAYLNKQGTKIFVTECTIGGTITRNGSSGEAPVGGLISRIQGSNTTLTIDGLSVTDAHITVKKPENQWASACGGLLGFEWKDTDATFTGVTVAGSTLDTDRQFGGLVYKGSGHWILTEENGITFTDSSFTGKSDNGSPSGLLVSVATEHPALYLEVLYGSYNDSGASVTLTEGSYFDSLVGKSINDGKTDAIVSISTAPGSENPQKIDQGECDTYRTALSQQFENPRTRYDYNLRYLDPQTDGDPVSNAAEMVLWSVLCRANDTLDAYFTFQFPADKRITGTIDLTGYAFYPVPYEGSAISEADITFNFEQLERVEGAAGNKKPSDAQRQHAGMHTGIFTTVNGNATLSVRDLTLRGNIGSCNGNYGAIIRDSAAGNSQESMLALDIQGVRLSGIRVSPAPADGEVKPLLIGSIGSYTTLNMSGVTTEAGCYSGEKAASSLIGRVGNGNADFIQLTFGDMRLEEAGDKNGKCGIFTRAMFLESFQYSGSNCRGAYNFERDDDYTLGQEISNTEGGAISGRNNGEQYWFYRENGRDSGLVCTVVVSSDSATAFADYPRYVYGTENGTSHEIDINLVSPDLLIGCGTYSHPYLITNGKQLEALSQAITAGGSRSGWKVKVNDPVMATTVTAGGRDFSKQDAHTGSGTGEEEEILDAETVYTSGNGIWTGSDNSTVTDGRMLEYLCNAYYRIEGEITLTNWSGLGTHVAGQQFQGVLTGNHGTVVIESVSSSDVLQFGGLVKFSRGCVIRDLTVVYRAVPAYTCHWANSALDSSPFFGGVVGWALGGDTVIDNVTVRYDTPLTIDPNTGSNRIIAVGGYVGIVGGWNNLAGGGVIFRNIGGSAVTPSGLYTNAYIGRVLDGFALSEGEPLQELTSDYRIPNPTGAAISVGEAGTVTVSNGAGLWVLSAMVNSSGGSGGKSRGGDYSQIGTLVSEEFLADEKPGSASYLAQRYTGGRSIPNSLRLTLDGDCDVSGFGNGFRGIGANHGDNHQAPTLVSVNGNGHTVTMGQEMRCYSDGDNWPLSTGGLFPDPRVENATVSALNLNGTVTLNRVNAALQPQGTADAYIGMLMGKCSNGSALTLSGVTVRGTAAGNAKYAGGLIGLAGGIYWSNFTLTATDCRANNLTVSAEETAGGLFGYVRGDNCALTLTGCGYEDITVSSCSIVGGLVGKSTNGSVKITGAQCSGGTVRIPEGRTPTASGDYKNGLGGLVGFIENGSAEISGITFSGTNTILSTDTATGNELGIGGLVGMWQVGGGQAATVSSVSLNGALTVTGGNAKSSVGALAGYICANGDATDWGSNTRGFSLSASQIHIGDESGSNVAVSGHQAGGLVGMYKCGKDYSLTMDSIHIGAEGGQTVTVTGGSNGAAASLIATLCKCPTVAASNLFLYGNSVRSSRYTALLFANPDNQTGAKLTFNIRNLTADGCQLTGGGNGANPGTGFLYGSMGSNNGKGFQMNGYNMLARDCAITDGNGGYPKNSAIWGGLNKNGMSVRLVAVSAVNCDAPAKDFASGDSCYAIRADYTGAQSVTAMDAPPYVPSNPQSPLGTLDGRIITGDGASFAPGGATPMGKKIYTEANAGSSKTHFGAADAAAYFKTNDGWVTTYAQGGGNTDTASIPDFPVLIVPADTTANVTEEIFQYITLLTNQAFDTDVWPSRVKAIEANTYRWADGSFQKQTAASLTVDSRFHELRVTRDSFDNQRNQFTLLDVEFTNPTDEQGEGYHLYIPIIVEKVLEFKFWASADVGTTYSASIYDALSRTVISSHGETVTALVGYEYQRSRAEWQELVDDGEDLLWGFQKSISIGYQSGSQLPDGTMLTLVDRNDMDRAYFLSTTPGNEISFEAFGWTPTWLCDSLKLTAEESAEGGYVLTEEAAGDATLRIGTVYYRPYSAETDGEEAVRYHVTVGLGEDEKLCEQYYLTILTPGGTDSIVNLLLMCRNRLTPSDGAIGVPTKRIKAGQFDYTRNSSENQIILGTFFKQTVQVSATTEDRLISAMNNTVSAVLKTSIEFAGSEAATLFKTYGQGKKLFQRFDLSLTRWEDGAGAQTVLAPGTILEAEYLLDGSPAGSERRTLNGEASAKLSFPGDGIRVDALGDGTRLELTVNVRLTYTDAGILAQFPIGSSDDAQTGTFVCASSHLAYSPEALAKSSSSLSGKDDTRRYYRAEYGAASLFYVATGSNERNRLDQLGVNGLEGSSFAIHSAAQYDIKALSAAARAASLRCTVTLLRKNDAGEYVACSAPFSASIGASGVSAGGSAFTLPIQSGTDVIFPLSGGLDNSVPVQIPVELTVDTAESLERGSNFYANYRVRLEVMLLDSAGNPIADSAVSDYIVYTNAKIVTSLIRG